MFLEGWLGEKEREQNCCPSHPARDSDSAGLRHNQEFWFLPSPLQPLGLPSLDHTLSYTVWSRTFDLERYVGRAVQQMDTSLRSCRF